MDEQGNGLGIRLGEFTHCRCINLHHDRPADVAGSGYFLVVLRGLNGLSVFNSVLMFEELMTGIQHIKAKILVSKIDNSRF